MNYLLQLTAVLLSLASPLSALPTDPFAGPVSIAALPTTENGLSEACKDVTVIFARGTSEAGNVGEIAGPPWFSALRSSLGTAKIGVQGVTYPATVAGYLAGGDSAGSTEMLRLINLASTQCPSTKIVLGGYSQGAQLVHNAAKKLTAAVTAKIAAVVVFGDPFRGDAVGTVASSKVDSICHDLDVVCTGFGGFITHLTYGNDAAAASAFVVARV
ncbi:cutinase-domain-containing protein [Bisporella sp. PMI_857]|nr:cutinase-domain-containing protein [Bisporella sp. PMI_857]